MRKAFLVLAVAILSAFILTACGAAIDTNGAFTRDAEAFVGEWDWDVSGELYYTFNADGTGLMLNDPLRWAAGDGLMSICVTPGNCGTRCTQPLELSYTFDGNNSLTLSSQSPSASFSYVRR